jgi:hypothetical protein
MEEEGQIYLELHAKGVKHIAPFECAANIPGHQTLTPMYAKVEWAPHLRSALWPHQHYRLVLGIIGQDLTLFKSTRELITVMRDAIIGKSNSIFLCQCHELMVSKLTKKHMSLPTFFIVMNNADLNN